MVIREENHDAPDAPDLPESAPAPGDAEREHPAPEPGSGGTLEPAAGAEAAPDAAPGGAPVVGGDRTGLLSLTEALDDPDEPDALAVSDRDSTSSATTDTTARTGGSLPSPLDALDNLGALDGRVNLLSGRSNTGAAEPAEGEPLDPTAQFQTIFRQAALDDIREHAESQDKVEVCGVLVGSVYENASGAFAYVEGCVRGTYAAGRTAQVTFTAETWQHIDREMDEKFPGRKIVGWYHTHPGFGIFLSEMDLFIQRHFFSAPWQTAFVYDPLSKERGLFGWNGSEIVRQAFVLDNEVGPAVTESAGPNLSPKPHALEEAPAGGPPGTAAELSARIKLLEQRQRYMLVGMAALMLVAVVWPLVVLVVMSSPDGAGGPAGAGSPPPVSPTPTLDRPDSSASRGADSPTARLPLAADN